MRHLALGLLAACTLCVAGEPADSPDARAAHTVRSQTAHAAPEAAAALRSQGAAVHPATTWTPQVSDTWQWQLTGTIDTSYDVKVYDVDLFDTPDNVLASLHAQGRKVVCYFSAGSAENWRPDYDEFLPSDLGKPLDGWPGERWVDTTSGNVRNIMTQRLDLAQQRGCDGVEPDNVDAYTNRSGFQLTPATQIDYNTFLANAAHQRGLRVALKNDVDQLAQLQPSFDFALNEQCHQYNECGGYSVFTNAGKPVFNAEYKKTWATNPAKRAQLCQKSEAADLRTLVLPVDLNDAYRYSCDPS